MKGGGGGSGGCLSRGWGLIGNISSGIGAHEKKEEGHNYGE